MMIERVVAGLHGYMSTCGECVGWSSCRGGLKLSPGGSREDGVINLFIGVWQAGNFLQGPAVTF